MGVNLLVTPALIDALAEIFARLLSLGVGQATLLRPKPPSLPGGDAAWYAANRLRRADLICLRRVLTAWQGALRLHIDSALVGLMGDVPPSRLRQRGVYGCAPGRRICTVWPDGQVTPCSFLGDLVAGNAREMPFAVLWARGQGWERLRDPARLPGGRCAGCAVAAQCGGTRCIARCEQGDLDGGDDACAGS
ncbi:MAG: SPASM domain-containing protein [Anaerolineae bacterium]|nr:SPASM domain-containing protein [Anaerolineae bacterium]